MRIIIVAPESAQLESLSRGLALNGHDCLGFTEPEAAAEMLNSVTGKPVDLLLIDLSVLWPELLSLVAEVLRAHAEVPVVAIGGLTRTPELEGLSVLGVPVLQGPFGPDQLDRHLRAAVKQRAIGRVG